MLKNRLHELNVPCVFTREPPVLAVAAEIKYVLFKWGKDLSPMTEAALFAAMRHEHARLLIHPALESSHHVICDRYLDSSLAYQGHALGLGFDTILALNRGVPKPDLTILLDIDPELALFRLKRRDDYIENRPPEFFEKVAEGYRKLALSEPERFVVVNAALSREELHERIWDIVRPMLVGE